MHRDGFRVALCGEGADESFAGYAPLAVAFNESAAEGQPVRDECLSLMNRVSLQRVDRCSMRYSVETREPFLDPAVVNYALNLDASALVREVNGLPTGKMPLRDLYDLYPDELPASIRDRTKVPFGEGAGLDTGKDGWMRRFNEAMSDAELSDGKKEIRGFQGPVEGRALLPAQAVAGDRRYPRAAFARPRLDFLPGACSTWKSSRPTRISAFKRAVLEPVGPCNFPPDPLSLHSPFTLFVAGTAHAPVPLLPANAARNRRARRRSSRIG